MRGHQAALGELPPGRGRVVGEPVAELGPLRGSSSVGSAVSTGASVGCAGRRGRPGDAATGGRDGDSRGRGARGRGPGEPGNEESDVSSGISATSGRPWPTCSPTPRPSSTASHTRTWREFDQRADNVARWLLGAGVAAQDKVALYLYNCPEYLEASFAAYKVGLVPINTNYRYADDELVYLWENADAVAVVFHGVFVERIEGIRHRVPGVRSWLWVDDGTATCPPWAVPYEEAAETTGAAGARRARAGAGALGARVPTTSTCSTPGAPPGCPRGSCGARTTCSPGSTAAGSAGTRRTAAIDGGARRAARATGPGMTLLPACPLMHGTGGFTAMECLSEGGRVVTLTSRQFDPVELLDTVEREQVNCAVIVGDAFARPILAALDAEPGPVGPDQPVGIISSGVMWSEETKQGLLRHHPGMLLIDAFGSSEALGSARRCRPATPPPRRPSSASDPTSGSSTPTAATSSPVRAESGCWRSAGGSRSATTRTRPRRRPPSG